MNLAQQIQQLDRRIAAAVEETLAALRRDLGERLQRSSAEMLHVLNEVQPKGPTSFIADQDLAPLAAAAAASARASALAELQAAASGIDRAAGQPEVLRALLDGARGFASRAALFLARRDGAEGWAASGFGDLAQPFESLVLRYDEDPAWASFAQGKGPVSLSTADCARLCSRLETELPRDGLLVPLVLRDRVAAALYVDRLHDDGPLEVAPLQLLVHLSALALETQAFRQRPSTPTLAAPDSVEGKGLEVWDTAATAAPVQVAPEPRPQVTAPAPEPPPATGGATAEAADEYWLLEEEAAPAAAPAPPAAPPWEEITRTKPAAQTAVEPLGQVEEIYQPAVSEDETVLLDGAAAEDTDETQPNLRRLASTAPIASPFAAPAAVPPSATAPSAGPAETRAVWAPSASPEVHPPADVEGPGWAFATTRVPVVGGEESLHEEARRLARLLVSEIKLYNEEQVEEGRRNRDIYERLKEDIDRSRQMYEERVDELIRHETDYFYQELVRILGGGDSKALGI